MHWMTNVTKKQLQDVTQAMKKIDRNYESMSNKALVLVDMLMRKYAFARNLSPCAEKLSDDLRRLVANWICTPD